MCGRINLSDHKGIQQLLSRLGIKLDESSFIPRHNIAPGADIPAAFSSDTIDLAYMHWGIAPHWARNKPGARPLINARIETALEKPSFRQLMRNNRAIIPVNGFYEWRRTNTQKTPYYIDSAEYEALALAGIFQITPEGTLEVAILTKEGTGMMASIHHRMPVLLTYDSMTSWLAPQTDDAIMNLLIAQKEPGLRLIQVSSYVNNTANEGAACIRPVAA